MAANRMMIMSKLTTEQVEERRVKRVGNNVAKIREDKGLVTVEEVNESDNKTSNKTAIIGKTNISKLPPKIQEQPEEDDQIDQNILPDTIHRHQ